MVEVVGRFTKRLILTGGCNMGRALPDGFGGGVKQGVLGSLGGVNLLKMIESWSPKGVWCCGLWGQ